MQIRTMAQCALFSALMCVCAWISIPLPVGAVTLQTFALFLTLGLLGGKRGSVVCLVYLLLGMVGLPVFSGFRGGLGALLGTTGGYIMGFLAASLVYWGMTYFMGKSFLVRLTGLILGMAACYTFGTVWFLAVYLQGGSAIGFGAVVAKCVLPYLIPDGIKLVLALMLMQKLKPIISD